MAADFIAQHAFNALMLGLIYAMVALGFSLFFGVLDVIQFAHGDVLAVGAFTGLGVASSLAGLTGLPPGVTVPLGVVAGTAAGAVLGVAIGRGIALPLRAAPAINVLFATLVAGTILRELIRLFVPGGGNPKPFMSPLPNARLSLGSVAIGLDSLVILVCGFLATGLVYIIVARTRIGLAIRAVAQDEECARLAGIDARWTVLLTFALGSGLAAFAGCLIGIYYREITFNMGVLLGIVGFAAATIGGLGSLLGALLGGVLFAIVQTLATVALPFSSAYKDTVAFAVIIIMIAIFPTGLIPAKAGERV